MAMLLDALLPGLASQPIQWVEVLAAVALAVLLRLRPRWLRPLGTIWRRVEPHPALFLTGLAVCLGLAHVALEWEQPRRAPAVHDEFGYLLTAETFLQGRLTNPTPPDWQALETVHVNFVPSYSSMYPPGQPAALAASWRWLGEPIYANWILAPLLGLATWWMLGAWLRPRWALLGGGLVALRLGLFGYWAESYMTGALPALGALVFAGAVPRLLRRPTPVLGAGAGLAIGVMFACRPFEAVVLGACSVPLPWLVTARADARRLLLSALPGLALFGLMAAVVAVHNDALTGRPLRFGYDLNMERHGYGVFPGARTVGTEASATPHMAAFYDETRRYAAYGWTGGGFASTRLRNLGWTWVYLVGPLLTLGAWHWRRSLGVPRLRTALPGLLAYAVTVALNPWSFAHYHAGTLGFLVAFALTGMRLWCARHRVRPRTAAAATFAVAVLVVAVRAIGGSATVATTSLPIEWLPYHTPPGLEERRAFERDVATTGPSLVFVRYGPHESARRDWVYNRPDPTTAHVVWVNDLGPDTNARTARTYPGRRWHCIEIDGGRPRAAGCGAWVDSR